MNTFITTYLAAILDSTKRILSNDSSHAKSCTYSAMSFLGDSSFIMAKTFPNEFSAEDAAKWVSAAVDELEKEFPERIKLGRLMAQCQGAYDQLILQATGNYKNPLAELLEQLREPQGEDTPEEAVFGEPVPASLS